MKLPDLFSLLESYCLLISGDDLLTAISDMSLPSEWRGIGKNPMYGPYKHTKKYTEDERLEVERATRQRWASGGRKIKRTIAKFWHQHFDIPTMIDSLEQCWKATESKSEISTILKNNGYDINREGVSDFLATMLKQGLLNLLNRGSDNNIDDQPWDSSLVRANIEEISALRDPKVTLAELDKDDIKVIGDTLFLGSTRISLPPAPHVPQAPGKMERNYLRQLLLAIGSASDLDIDSIRARTALTAHVEAVKADVECNYPEYEKDISDARESYFHADHLRLVLRDNAVDGEAEFERIKNETYFAVSPTARRRHPDGLEKMYATLEKAVSVPLQQSHVTGVSGLFTLIHRHGITHMLVNDNKIEWVNDES